MTVSIRPLAAGDLEALGRFLTSGFQTPADAEFAAVDVLRWKYLESQGDVAEPAPRSLVAVDEAGAIVGHVGFVPTAFAGPGLPAPVPALHMIDWLGSREHRSLGASLMRRAHEAAPVQFGLGGSDAGRSVIRRGGYDSMPSVTVHERILNPLRWLRAGGRSPGKAARASRDLARRLIHQPRTADARLELEPVSSFGPEVVEVVRAASRFAVVAARTPERLNYALRYPRQAPAGLLVRDADRRVRGFALVNSIPRDGGRIVLGRVVDLLLDDDDPDAWHAALLLLSRELARRGADVAQAFAAPPWTVEALRRAGFISRHPLDFRLRDRQALLPRDRPFYLTPIEADYAYT
ncbi:acetyltransferase [Paludisphaera mucosa]|uniref:Acetyltransferase n=1 Tax=Paludisphaera mucosa TaxID=3030827 RepID=A0ABT6FJT4_9BACT|nr:acetyltransferase [Paludisphaera mucosa]MDG3007769.1 acetyltransferase [Paludisphaera mucosa]